jgi:hypothetical protein
VADFLARDLGPSDGLVISVSAGSAVDYELSRMGIDSSNHSPRTPNPRRLLMVMARPTAPLPSPGNGLLNPFDLTLEGTLKEAGVNEAFYSPARLIYSSGVGEVFELLPLDPKTVPAEPERILRHHLR